MPTIPPPGNPRARFGPPARGFPVGTTGGKGKPIAPHALGGWTRFSGALATGLPTALRQASTFRRAALRSLK